MDRHCKQRESWAPAWQRHEQGAGCRCPHTGKLTLCTIRNAPPPYAVMLNPKSVVPSTRPGASSRHHRSWACCAATKQAGRGQVEDNQRGIDH
jgi:hypothetical protein